MGILELCKRRLNEGVTATDPTLLKSFPEVRSATKADYVYFSSIEDPAVFFILGVWPSLAAYQTFMASSETPAIFATLDKLSSTEWVEHMELDSMKLLPTGAPCMTVTRAFLKGGNNPQEYYRKISDLKAPIEEETKPHPVVFSWTIDTTPETHKWLMFVGWQSKKHHQDYAAMLRETNEEFPTIPAHYAEGTMHTHTFNMEKTV